MYACRNITINILIFEVISNKIGVVAMCYDTSTTSDYTVIFNILQNPKIQAAHKNVLSI